MSSVVRTDRFRRKLALLACFAVLCAAIALWRSRPPALTIGVEGRRVVTIDGARLYAAPFTPGDAVAVRIANVEPTPAGFRYDLRYMAFGPGEHNLAESLFEAGQVRPKNLPDLTIQVASILPKDHEGELFATPPAEINLHSNYGRWMTLGWLAWAGLVVPLWYFGRGRREFVAPAPRVPSTEERLQQLLEMATRGRLSPERQAELERLLLAFWQGRLNLPDERLYETLVQLRRHPIAGRQVALVETWLHRRDGAAEPAAALSLLSELSPEWQGVDGNGRLAR